MLLGALFGAGALAFDQGARAAIYPDEFGHLHERPSERVAREEREGRNEAAGGGGGQMHGTFSAYLIRNNISVSIRALALGLTYGVGTVVLLFFNGIVLGGVSLDYIADGQVKFLLGWLLPHGAIELPAVIIAGQAGLVLAGALIGHGNRLPLRARLRAIGPDLIFLLYGVAVMLVWAGIVESFFSQYHEPFLPYSIKIAFGCLELVLLVVFLNRSGHASDETATAVHARDAGVSP